MATVFADTIKGTTICAVKRNDKIAIAGDGQVTQGESVIMKGNAVKVRRIFDNKIVIGFAGTTADAFTLSEKLESMLQKFSGNLLRSTVELAQLWRRDNVMRKLEAMLIVADKNNIFLLSGAGDVIEPDDGICAIGSGGNYALAAAKALMANTDLSAREIAQKSLQIASEICVYTNGHITVEEV
ncbi:MAG: ATP-dependent protease subunit HslV [Clostridia bacterium]|nr:ATP-dependent protease subunit HslV [Clostridia bacterium]MBQ7914028.1 ATP-dependent protease subunit HslV [Clostridia bacterium]MBQ8504695.1 ATP-dependent protease subunit HslV [Clostridia bacterium]MBQ8772496.1 ATP-dependent protease subunit HslV [Clostridia bacterium]MBQ8873508.1 ATP-dependent protease subunit HslV [Clostridia bacterium]